MSSKSEAYAAYLKDIYAEYDARAESVAASADLTLSAVEGTVDFAALPIEDAVMLIFMQIAADAREDLRDILAEMKAANETKQRLRDTQRRLRERQSDLRDELRDEYDSQPSDRGKSDRTGADPCAALDTDLAVEMLIRVAARQSDDELQAAADDVILLRERRKRAKKRGIPKDERDSLDELSELMQLRLQMLLDRRSKLMEVLSNLLKKLSETQDAIVANLK